MGERKSNEKRSLHVFGALERGGAETWLLQAAAHRAASAWDCDICLLAGREGSLAPLARGMGLRVLHCPARPAGAFPSRFQALVRREQYHAVHAHVLLFSGAVAALAARAGVPLRVAHAHNSSDGRRGSAARSLYRGFMRRLIASRANLVLACSPEAAGAFDCGRTRILPYGIDLRPFAAPAPNLKLALGIPADAPVIGAAGRLIPQKNYPFLLDAFAAASDPGICLAIAGEGDRRAELERLIAARGLSNRVRLLGLRDDVPALMLGLFDAFVMPSLHEGLPVALLEAQAAGLPCLVSDRISPDALVLAERVERLPLNLAAWSSRLAEVARRPRFDPAVACAAMRSAGFDAADCWRRLTGLYDEALGFRSEAQAA